MGVVGDIIREVRDTISSAYENCGGEDVVDEIKDVIKALKGE